MGGFVSGFTGKGADGAVAFAVTDTGAAQDLLDKPAQTRRRRTPPTTASTTRSRAPTGSAYGIIGDFVVVGTEQGFKDAVDAYSGDSLADDSTATDALDSVPSDTLFSAYVDPKAAVDAAIAGGAITQKELDQSGASDQIDKLGDAPLIISGGATADSLSVAGLGPGRGQLGSQRHRQLPALGRLARLRRNRRRPGDLAELPAVRARLRARLPAEHAEPERPVRDDGALAAADPQHRRGDQAGHRPRHHQGLRLDRRRRRLPAGQLAARHRRRPGDPDRQPAAGDGDARQAAQGAGPQSQSEDHAGQRRRLQRPVRLRAGRGRGRDPRRQGRLRLRRRDDRRRAAALADAWRRRQLQVGHGCAGRRDRPDVLPRRADARAADRATRAAAPIRATSRRRPTCRRSTT